MVGLVSHVVLGVDGFVLGDLGTVLDGFLGIICLVLDGLLCVVGSILDVFGGLVGFNLCVMSFLVGSSKIHFDCLLKPNHLRYRRYLYL